MKISVIVTTYNFARYNDTISAVHSLLDQTYPNIEILIVVDRNELLFSKLVAEFSALSSNIKIVLSKGGGLSNSRNTGVEHSIGEIVAFMDDDAIADKNWILNIIRNYNDPTVIGVGGQIKPLWLGNYDNSFPEEAFWIIGCTYRGYPQNKCIVRNNFGGNISFRRMVFKKVRFCSEVGRTGDLQLTSDETEFSIRLSRLFPSSKIIYDPAGVVFHRIYPYRLSLSYVIKRAFGDGFSKAYITSKFKGAVLSTERTYLTKFFKETLPTEIKALFLRRNKSDTLKRVTINLVVIVVVFSGYLIGMLKWSN